MGRFNIIKQLINIIETKKEPRKPLVWSRKGTCPGCGVGGGSRHSVRGCNYKYFATKGKYAPLTHNTQ